MTASALVWLPHSGRCIRVYEVRLGDGTIKEQMVGRLSDPLMFPDFNPWPVDVELVQHRAEAAQCLCRIVADESILPLLLEHYQITETIEPLEPMEAAELRQRLEVKPFTWKVLTIEEAKADLTAAGLLYGVMEQRGELEGVTADQMIESITEIYAAAMLNPVERLQA
jgi:hypothetical protein